MASLKTAFHIPPGEDEISTQQRMREQSPRPLFLTNGGGTAGSRDGDGHLHCIGLVLVDTVSSPDFTSFMLLISTR